jgi:hypothetical protein
VRREARRRGRGVLARRDAVRALGDEDVLRRRRGGGAAREDGAQGEVQIAREAAGGRAARGGCASRAAVHV